MNIDDDASLFESFDQGLIPCNQWRHKDHIRVAYLCLLRCPFDEALRYFRAKIMALNAAHAVPDLPHRGYHETMTQAWLRLVYLSLCEYGSAETSEVFYARHPELSHKSTLRLFYSHDLLTSPRAKAEFVEPDLAPLPRTGKSPPLASFRSSGISEPPPLTARS
jgi:hypothetical protein